MSDSNPSLIGGAPFSSPSSQKISSFFDSILKKGKDNSEDSSSTPTGGGSTNGNNGTGSKESKENASGGTNGKQKSSGPSMEDMQLLMDQLSALSQSLADAQMSNVELRQTNERTQELYDQMKIERDFMIAKSEAHEKEMGKLKEKISFTALDATNEQLKQLKLEHSEMSQENEALKSQNHILYQNYADINAEYQTLHELHESQTSEYTSLLSSKSELELERERLQRTTSDQQKLIDQLETQVNTLQSKRLHEQQQLETERLQAANERIAQLERELATVKDELHLMTTDRNRCKRMMESMQIDMKKLHQQVTAHSTDTATLRAENQCLREDLVRKSKSLQDSLAALAVAMETQSFRPPPTQPVIEQQTILVGSSSSSVSGRDLANLQLLCNRLSETIKEKDDMIGVLRKQCVGLGKRVIELEAGQLPDFSEAAHEQQQQQQEDDKAKEKAREQEQQRSQEDKMSSSNDAQRRNSHQANEPASSTQSSSAVTASSLSSASASTSSSTSAATSSSSSDPTDRENNFPKLSSYSGRKLSAAQKPITDPALTSAAASYLAGLNEGGQELP